MKATKAETLKDLSLLNKKLKFKIPKIFFFNYKQWLNDRDTVIEKINKKFSNKLIAVRSSARDEDQKKQSNAGKFRSIMNVQSNNKKKLVSSINKVFKSYSAHRNIYSNDQILIQTMINKISMSGVIFTQNLENRSPYYVINYDDTSGSTSSVTSGIGEASNRILYIHRDHYKQIRSLRFKNLIKAVKNLENNLSDNNLDIEFAVDKKFNSYLFQVRKLHENNINRSKNLKDQLEKKLKKLSHLIEKKTQKQKNILGQRSIFGNMPDWNPAEIVGRIPRKLDLSLFQKLITNNTWCKAREMMNYKKIGSKKLLEIFSGQPYVDTRLSFNSFLPSKIGNKLGEKIVNQWLKKLKDEPHQHDKIEFNVAITCFTFDIESKIKRVLPLLNKREKSYFIKKNYDQTINLIKNKNKTYGVETQINKIYQLKNIYKKYKYKNFYEDLKELKEKIYICKKLGTLPFSILARHAFISKALLDSLVEERIITDLDRSNFLGSIQTITSEFLNDINDFKKNKIKKNFLVMKYGHLRPGTYNINSKRYDEIKIFKKTGSGKHIIKKKIKFNLSHNKKNKLYKILKKNNINNLTIKELFEYFEKSIKYRELAKFYYTKYISDILKILKSYGKHYGLRTESIANLDVDTILNVEKKNKSKFDKKKYLINKISENKIDYEINSYVKLPQLIFDRSSCFVIPHIVSSPNFVTMRKLSGSSIKLKNNDFKKKIDKKIVLIENADPGFDWIFNKKIIALITKYGGANSHMAIRCNELKIPAAIGCGEKKFNELVRAKNIELDCSAKKITIV